MPSTDDELLRWGLQGVNLQQSSWSDEDTRRSRINENDSAAGQQAISSGEVKPITATDAQHLEDHDSDMEILPGKPASIITPRIEIDLTDDKSEDLENERERAEEQHSVKIKQESTEEQTLDMGTNTLTHKDNATQNDGEPEPEQPTRNDANESPARGDVEASRANEKPSWPRKDSDSDEDDADYETESDDEESDDERVADKDCQHEMPSIIEDNPGSPGQPTPLDDAERADVEREFNDRERKMLETFDDVPALPEQPSLDRGVLGRAPKSQKKKVIAAAKPILATATAATSRRVGPVLPPVSPTTREIFKDLVVKQKLKGRALYKKASDFVDDRGRLSKALASWITETDDDGAHLVPESFWSGISHIKNPAAANTTILNAGRKVRLRRQKFRVTHHRIHWQGPRS
jgi:hypothetical protein